MVFPGHLPHHRHRKSIPCVALFFLLPPHLMMANANSAFSGSVFTSACSPAPGVATLNAVSSLNVHTLEYGHSSRGSLGHKELHQWNGILMSIRRNRNIVKWGFFLSLSFCKIGSHIARASFKLSDDAELLDPLASKHMPPHSTPGVSFRVSKFLSMPDPDFASLPGFLFWETKSGFGFLVWDKIIIFPLSCTPNIMTFWSSQPAVLRKSSTMDFRTLKT